VLQMTANGSSAYDRFDDCGGVDSDMLFEDQISARPPFPDRSTLAQEAPFRGCPGRSMLSPVSADVLDGMLGLESIASRGGRAGSLSSTCWFYGGGLGYLDGWRLHVANHSDAPPAGGGLDGRSVPLHSEQGFDRLIGRSGVASAWGSILGAQQNGQTASWFGNDNGSTW